jgi:hypothetical protein
MDIAPWIAPWDVLRRSPELENDFRTITIPASGNLGV